MSGGTHNTGHKYRRDAYPAEADQVARKRRGEAWVDLWASVTHTCIRLESASTGYEREIGTKLRAALAAYEAVRRG